MKNLGICPFHFIINLDVIPFQQKTSAFTIKCSVIAPVLGHKALLPNVTP